MLTTEMSTRPAGSIVGRMIDLYHRVFGALERGLDGWFIELCARLLFAATLLVYYLNSVGTKLGEGVFGVFAPSAGAFAQIVPPIAEEYVYDTAAIPFFPWHLIVIAGTIAEMVLPVLLVLGLFTRLAALGMMGFVVVQTTVDVLFHGTAAGGWFDNQATELLDQRLLWIFPLLLLVIKGAGAISIDALLKRWKFA